MKFQKIRDRGGGVETGTETTQSTEMAVIKRKIQMTTTTKKHGPTSHRDNVALTPLMTTNTR